MPFVRYTPFLISIGLSLLAQLLVRLSYGRYDRVASARGYSGFATARQILDANGLSDVVIEEGQGTLTDHYNPQRKIIRLSESSFHSTSIAAVGVAAHETGHAIQHRDGYLPNRIRSALLLPANVGSMAGPYIAGLGFASLSSLMIQAGIALFAASVLFFLITLPVELNASRRALALLETSGILAPHELKGARRILMAASLTYVASALTSVLYFFQLVGLASSRRRR